MKKILSILIFFTFLQTVHAMEQQSKQYKEENIVVETLLEGMRKVIKDKWLDEEIRVNQASQLLNAIKKFDPSKERDQEILHPAIQEQKSNVLLFLLKQGLSAHPQHFVTAALNKDPKLFNFLCNSGLNVNTFYEFKNSPLYDAIYKNDLTAIKFLLEHGADANLVQEWTTDWGQSYKYTPMHATIDDLVTPGKIEPICKLLIEYGADRNAKNHDGKTAYDLCTVLDFLKPEEK